MTEEEKANLIGCLLFVILSPIIIGLGLLALLVIIGIVIAVVYLACSCVVGIIGIVGSFIWAFFITVF